MKMIIVLIFTALIAAAAAGPVVTVTDTQGRSLTAQLVSLSDTHATVKRITDEKVFELLLSSLKPESIKLLKEKAVGLPILYPKLDIKVTIGKRRVKGGSSILEKQNITTAITLKNTNQKLDFPKSSARVIYFGKDRGDSKQYKILAINGFDIAPKAGKTAQATLPSFITSHYNDSVFSSSSYGRYQYEGCLLIVWDPKKKIILYDTMNANITKALKADYSLLTRMITAKKDTVLDKNFASPPSKSKSGPIVIE